MPLSFSLTVAAVLSPVTVEAGVDLPDVASSTRLLDLQADALVFSDGDPVATWANVGTAGGSFTQTGSARPTYRAGGGTPYVDFDGVDDWMLGPDFADNLASFTVFMILKGSNSGSVWLSKMSYSGNGAGWSVGSGSLALLTQEAGGNVWLQEKDLDISYADTPFVLTGEFADKNTLHYSIDGVLIETTPQGSGTVVDMSTAEPVRLGANGDIEDDGSMFGGLFAVMLYAPAPNASDRAAITAWLADKYGVAL